MDAIDVDATTPEDIVVDRERDSVLWGAVRSLGDRTWHIMQLRFGRLNEPMRLDDIGRLYGITRERVRQIESATLAKLREPSIAAARKLETAVLRAELPLVALTTGTP